MGVASGGASETATEVVDSLIWAPTETFSRGLPIVPPAAFESERCRARADDAPHGAIVLDISDQLGCPDD